MKFPAWLIVTFGILLAQVQPAGASALRPAAMMACCGRSGTCADHAPAPDPGSPSRDCAPCMTCGPAAPLAVPAVVSALDCSVRSVVLQFSHGDSIGRTRRDPPPLPPPRGAA